MPQLDGLRALAVAAVLLHHLLDHSLLPRALAGLPLGYIGVRLFFVLSGFLITSILVHERDQCDQVGTGRGQSLRAFYLRRSLRIFPVYYFVLSVVLVFGAPAQREQLPWLASHTYNLYLSALGWWPAYFSHFWSLSVEEQFYLVWPWVMLFAPRRRLQAACWAMISIAPAYQWLAIQAQFGPVAIYAFPLASLDALGLGAWLALACNGRAATEEIVRRLRNWALPVGLVGLLLPVVFSAYGWGLPHRVFLEALITLVFVWLVAAASRGIVSAPGRWLQLPALRYLGKISYGIYIYHLFTPHLLRPLLGYAGLWLPPLGVGEFALSSIVTILLAALSWTLLERPIISLNTRFAATRRAAAA